MFFDIFSDFDDHNKTLLNIHTAIWLAFVIGVFFRKGERKPLLGMRHIGIFSVVKIVSGEMVRRTYAKDIGGSSLLFASLSACIFFFNSGGMLPYVFSLGSHMAINFALALVMWVTLLLLSLSYDLGSFFSHLQPLGSPTSLNPFLCVIEFVSLGVRPLTLCVRLAANLSTGHILMSLMGSTSSIHSFSSTGMSFVLGMGTFYFVFEICVCIVQAYIFTLLPTLYSDEHPDKK